MNALAPKPTFDAAYLDAVIARYGNGDDLAKPQALRNLGSRQPAYWTKAGYGHGGANLLRDEANNHVGIEAGMASIPDYARSTREWIDLNTIAALDTLVPLNDEAVADLMDAYEIAGTFRSAKELSDRRTVNLFHAVRAAEVA